jgi:TRAP-type C4-dicarboxylate transport system substrate-binding protein
MKKVITAAAVVALGMSSPAIAEEVLKFSFFGPGPDPTFADVLKPWADAINAEGTGKVKIDTFPGGGLGRNPAIQLKLVQDGVADAAWIVPSYTPGRFPDNEVLELPGVIRDVKESSVAFRRLYDKGLIDGYGEFYVVLLSTTHPYFINTVKPVSKLEDLKGMKLRAGGPVAGDSMRAIGVTPVGMPIPAVAENISKGVLDGSAAEWNVLYAFRIIEVAKNHYMGRLGTVPLGVIMNKERYDGLSADVRAIIDKHSGEGLSKKFGEVHLAVQVDKNKQTRNNPDHRFTDLDEAEQQKWDAAMKPVVENWIQKHPKGQILFDALNKELDAIRSGS